MPERISSVYDIPDWLAEKLPSLTGPVRTAWNAGLLPIDVGADLLRRGTHGALGLEEEAPYRYSGERMHRLVGALGDTAAPARAMVRMGAEGLDAARQALRESLLAHGARPVPENAPATPQPAVRGIAGYGPGGEYTAPARASRPPQRRVSRAIQEAAPVPRGALEVGTEGFEGLAAQSAQDNAALAALGPAAVPVAAPAQPGLADRYRQRVAGIDPMAGRELSKAQKDQLALDFYLRLLAAGSKPGARFLGSLGESGLGTSALMRQLQEVNRRDAGERARAAREEAFRELFFADKEADNQARLRQLGITEEHYRAMDVRDRERLRLLGQQIAQGKWRLMEDGKTGNYILWDQDTGARKDTGIKVSTKDTRPAEVQLIDRAIRDPKFREALLELRGIGKKDDVARVFEAAMDLQARDLMGRISPEEAMRRARNTMAVARGQAAPELPRFSTADELQRAIKEGKVKKGDRVIIEGIVK
jgi:hypothetical protein